MLDEREQCLSREERDVVQADLLHKLCRHVYDHVDTYRKKFDEFDIDPASINTVGDIASLPFTVKDDLRAAYPYKMFAAPMDDIVRVHSSSGTTGQVSVVGYTQRDLDMWSRLVARALDAAGATAADIMQISYGYGLFTGGLGLHYGTEHLGATAIPVSGGNTQRQIQILRDFGVTGIAATPSYAVLIAETAQKLGVDLRELPIRFGIFGAEPWSNALRAQIEEAFGLEAFDIYGLSEILGPGVGFECHEHDGLHINEDHFLIEILDTETLAPVADGTYGEVVFTTLTKEGIPLLRYRTRDISRIVAGDCACGRTTRRLERITGRSDDMLIIRGVNVYPSQIEQVLLDVAQVAPHYQIVLSKKGALDDVEVRVELDPQVDFDEIRSLERITNIVKDALASALAISVRVKLVESGTITRSEGKAQRLVDLRNAEEEGEKR
ncbi:MAG: phenylacetate--CoA ligase [Coriobacteriia bacterium]|nr:phenylacetate--CoA ligase [Coriobacteriia bacterium]